MAVRPPGPEDRGTVGLIVARGPSETRTTPGSVDLCIGQPLPGDRWSQAKDPECLSQLTAMELSVARTIANGQPLSLFGDNLLLDLALDERNLPPGSRLRVGEALLEVTPEPHTGCKKYRRRFGLDALKWISEKSRRGQRLRGVHLRVVEPGRVGVGDPVQVISR